MFIYEAFKMAIAAIWSHKLRSFLTLVGIIAGIASIIAVMTGISVIQGTIEKEMSVLGTQTFQVQKWANGPTTREERRKIMRRRPTLVKHANAIRERVKTVDLVGSELWSQNRHKAKYRDISTNKNLTVCGATPEYPENNTHYVRLGRNISNEDVKVSRNVVVIGFAVAQELFPWIDPILKTIKIDGLKFQVVGVLEEKKSAFGGNFDNYMLIPITRFKRIFGMKDSRGRDRSVNITVRAKSPELLQDAVAETRAVMRMERGLKPHEEDDFTIFTNDSSIKTFNEQTAAIKVGAFVIGIVALIVAGIGIMNIMFVSVTERTKEIGIRKSMGAKRKNILMQFLLEAIIMCNIGGVIGVAMGFGLGNILSMLTDFTATVPLEWAVVGLIFCTSVGLSFGFWPAFKASKMDPIEALRYD
ncbi:ABC transporter permease [candidate division KSB1 bacterium]|nr:ABC transporter permease [candidate division KSB1 bacterium]MBL7094665.1 ABC transporter permease [candidate division KSB1 bacterium]